MKIKKYIKKAIPIEAVCYVGYNIKEIEEFVGKDVSFVHSSVQMFPEGLILTLEGAMNFTTGDYIIKGVRGEFYACRGDIFEETYKEVLSDSDVPYLHA
jgi:hypothetical protein